VAVNPAAITDSLMESELFGHERGAFTGAYQRKLGRFELAQGGTLFLDEIGSLKPEMQAKLLRVLQEREMERVGGTHTVKLDVRIIAATNADLRQGVASQTFREDLFYRLNVVQISMPPLRDRRDDIGALADHFIRRYRQQFGKPVAGLAPEALAALAEYSWPGNVRELQNVIERCVALADGPSIRLSDLPLEFMIPDARVSATATEALNLEEAHDGFERQIVRRVLDRVDWNQSEAARLLGMHRNTLKVKMARWGLKRSETAR
jgi:two-component system NtrC family response regulator